MYHAEAWSDFGVAVAGAAAALTGLLFVAVSINLERILQYPRLPARAAATLGTLVVVLAIALFTLVPGQGRSALGVETVVASGALATLILVSHLPMKRAPGDPLHWFLFPIAILLAPALLLLLGGVSLVLGTGGGLYWVLAGVVAAFIACTLNAWVLLIEIQR
ncbi:hypothetical protein [Nocardioides sp. GXQ0305]|uniref:hypothetical protein n=1 Tax=Nocardioides sp. GXQ0305 TaxID=3423912 RepID=UPI003D7CE300